MCWAISTKCVNFQFPRLSQTCLKVIQNFQTWLKHDWNMIETWLKHDGDWNGVFETCLAVPISNFPDFLKQHVWKWFKIFKHVWHMYVKHVWNMFRNFIINTKCSIKNLTFKQVYYNIPFFLQTCFKVIQKLNMVFQSESLSNMVFQNDSNKNNVSSKKRAKKTQYSQSLLVKHLFEAVKHVKHRTSYDLTLFQSDTNTKSPCFKILRFSRKSFQSCLKHVSNMIQSL